MVCGVLVVCLAKVWTVWSMPNEDDTFVGIKLVRKRAIVNVPISIISTNLFIELELPKGGISACHVLGKPLAITYLEENGLV